MSNKKTFSLSEEDILKISKIIGKPTYNYMHKKIEKEVGKIPNSKNLDMESGVYIIMSVLCSICTNSIELMRNNLYEISKGKAHLNTAGLAKDLMENIISNLKQIHQINKKFN